MAVRPVTSSLAQFLPPGHALEVGGHALPDGMVWVGTSPEPGSDGEPSTIDATLPVAEVASRRDDESMWPAGGYGEMRPGGRAAYLRWLADGRRNPRIDVAYVLLFLGGLERRLLVEPGDADERERLLAEVRRLTGIYGRNPVIRRHATDLFRAVPLRFRAGRVSDGPPPDVEEGAPLPTDLRIGLAELARDGRPLPADWALAWLRAHPEARLRTPARRAPAEFDELFRRRYTADFGDGMLLSPIKTRLDVDYRPVNPSLGASVSLLDPDLSEIAPLLAPVGRLRTIADDVARELDPYSRWLGRNPDGAGSPAARALLPAALTSAPGPRTEELYRHLDAALDGADVGCWPTVEVLDRWNPAASGRVSRDEARMLGETLAAGGYGLEPDVRFGGPAPSPDGVVVVFRLRHGDGLEPSDRYLAAALTLQLAAAVTGSAGHVTAAEERLLEEHLEEALLLTDAERERLRAHLRWVVDSEPGLSGVRSRIRRLPREDRAAVGRFLVGVAATDGRVLPAEVATLTKIFRLLGLQPETVYRQLHGLITGAPTPPAGAPGAVEGRRAGVATDPPAGAPVEAEPLVLDRERIERTLQETHAVSALLSSIFAEDDGATSLAPLPGAGGAVPAAAAARVEPDHDGTAPGGLDAPHLALLRALATRPHWTRAAFDREAAERRLLPDGALDRLNEAAFDVCDAPLLDGDDPLELDTEVLEELLQP